ncbi:Regulator of chromosome condensation (RCC1) repeat-containing protein [Deinococcus reticulitermitis]|uniref:Regulator of chromosome condensation (RCC1) repeat-containing protein n=1 Tax=Deinococcus reticulitermitis TaxID=856736 RepID=A0A1H7ARZ8_9DEIO|nr:Regulator of chromosome condensation (RCC1) repeat-containing protein [Deinococcus reticulitermitis]
MALARPALCSALASLTALMVACGTSDQIQPPAGGWASDQVQRVAHAVLPSAASRSAPLQALGVDGVARVAGEIVAFGPGAAGFSPVPPLPAGVTYAAVAAGTWHAVALRSDGQVVAWGDQENGNTEGQLAVPALPAGVTYTTVAAGGTHSIALRSDGQVVTWGDQTGGLPPVPELPAGTRYAAVAAGVDFNLALRSDGQVVAWLTNNPGYYSVIELRVPPLPAGVTYTGIQIMHPSTAVAYRSDGEVVVWGQRYWQPSAAGLFPRDLNGVPYAQVAAVHPLERWDAYALLTADGLIRTKLARNIFRDFSESESPEERVPGLPEGTSYVRVASGGTDGDTYSADGAFMALRNDGRLVVWGTAAQVPVPGLASGQRYTSMAVGGQAPDALVFLAIRQATPLPGVPPAPLPHPAPTAPGRPVLAGPVTVLNRTEDGAGFNFTFAPSQDVTKVDPPVYRFVVTNQRGQTFSEDPANLLSSEPARSFMPFLPAQQMEGTWRVRVQASHQEVAHWSALSEFAATAVQYDFTPPSPPTATVSGTRVGDWYRDSAQVNLGGSTDPLLADGSVPRGGVTYQGHQTYAVSGTFTYQGTARDAAGNVSRPTAGRVQVDADAPRLTLSCPPSVTLGSAPRASWTATDAESGLQGPGSGTLLIDTATTGEQTLTVQARDRVGHETQGTCTVSVTAGGEAPVPPGPTFPFEGFMPPVDNPPFLNVHRAGSTIPLSFSLGGDQGLDILAPGSPRVSQSDCQGRLIPGGLSLSADSAAGLRFHGQRYSYLWRTAKTMQGCWVFRLQLTDGTEHRAFFRLR